MSTYIKTLIDENGDEIIPRTRTSAVTTSDGTLVEDAIDAKVDKTALRDAGITAATYTQILTFTATTATTSGFSYPYALINKTVALDKTKRYKVVIGSDEFVLPCEMSFDVTSSGFKVWEYLGNISLQVTSGASNGFYPVRSTLNFLLMQDRLGNSKWELLTTVAGTYTVTIYRENATVTNLPNEIIWGQNYSPIKLKDGGGSTFCGVSVGGTNNASDSRGTVAIGDCNTVSADWAMAFGVANIASGVYSHAEGYGTTASGEPSHAEGCGTTASGNYSHAEGYGTTASGFRSHAEGRETTASGNDSHTEGHNTTASNNQAHAEGYGTTASDGQAHAEGHSTTASGLRSHAEGYITTASGDYSHSEGYGTTASGDYSHAKNEYTKSTRKAQTVIGRYNAEDTASGLSTKYFYSESIAKVYTFTAEALNPTVTEFEYFNMDTWQSIILPTSAYSVAINGTSVTVTLSNSLPSNAIYVVIYYSVIVADGSVYGKYAEIVGNGTADNARSNAHTLDWSGNAWYSGDVYVGSTSGTNRDAGSKKLAKEEQLPQVVKLLWR